jgi:hypothetical protein
MVWLCVRRALLTSALLATAAVPARAADGCAAPAAPATRTVCVRECVPETFTTTRTVYTPVCQQQNYTAYRCETVPVQQTRTVTTYKMVPQVQTVCRTVWECVPTCETRTVMKTRTVCKPVTTMCRRCVDHGHYECRQVPCQPSLWERLKKCCHADDCCQPCAPPKMKTQKVWVPCKVWETYPVTKTQRVRECYPVTCQVTVMKRVAKQVQQQVTVCRCVPQQQTVTCTAMTTRMIPYQATRTVTVCVPKTEQVTCTRMVWRTVQKQVPAETCCETSCQTSCCQGRRHGLFAHKQHGCCD